MKNILYKLFDYQKFQKEPELDSIISKSLEKLEAYTVKESDLSLVFGGRDLPVGDDAIICSKCGTTFAKIPNLASQCCPSCGEKVDVD